MTQEITDTKNLPTVFKWLDISITIKDMESYDKDNETLRRD